MLCCMQALPLRPCGQLAALCYPTFLAPLTTAHAGFALQQGAAADQATACSWRLGPPPLCSLNIEQFKAELIKL